MSGIPNSPTYSCNNNEYIWIINNGVNNNSVSKLSILTGALINTIQVGTNPSGICIDASYVWISNQGSNTVSRILITNDQVSTLTLDTGSNPTSICNDGDYIWTSNSNSKISHILKNPLTVVQTISITGTNINLRGICSDGTNIWVTDFSNNVVYKNTYTGTYTSPTIYTIPVGINPFGICTDGTYVWIANNGSNTISQILISSGLISTITVGNGPLGICTDGTYVWIANNTSNNVSQFLISSQTVINTIQVGNNPYGAFDDGTYVWVCNNGNNTISKIEIPSPPCFKKGTKILTNNGYKPIENLKPGDLVKTLLDGYKPIFMIGYSNFHHNFSNERIKRKLYNLSPNQYPDLFEDLVLTGCHCVLVKKFTSEEQRNKTIEVNGDIYITDNHYRIPCCADERASVYNNSGNYTIYHLALEHNDYYMNYGIYANGLLVETCSKRYLKELSNMVLIQN